MTFLHGMNIPNFTKKRNMIKFTALFLLFVVLNLLRVKAEQLYVNPQAGKDTNSGLKAQPLKTMAEAARRVNQNKAQEETTIILSEGVPLLTQTVLFNNDKYSLNNRLTIRAESDA
jgi:hypothetical protein